MRIDLGMVEEIKEQKLPSQFTLCLDAFVIFLFKILFKLTTAFFTKHSQRSTSLKTPSSSNLVVITLISAVMSDCIYSTFSLSLIPLIKTNHQSP